MKKLIPILLLGLTGCPSPAPPPPPPPPALTYGVALSWKDSDPVCSTSVPPPCATVDTITDLMTGAVASVPASSTSYATPTAVTAGTHTYEVVTSGVGANGTAI